MARAIHKVDDLHKYCGTCKETKLLEDFYKDKRNRCGRQSRCIECVKDYAEKNKIKILSRNKKWYRDNHKEILECRAELRKRPEAKKKKVELDKKYYQANKNKISLKYKVWASDNRARLRYNYKEWYRQNLEHARMQSRIGSQLRRARKKKVRIDATKEQIEQVFIDQPFCSYCGQGEELTLDHLDPLNNGGNHSVDNFMILCSACNSSKRDKSFLEWLTYKSFINYLKQKDL